jgi:hypothetical protein
MCCSDREDLLTRGLETIKYILLPCQWLLSVNIGGHKLQLQSLYCMLYWIAKLAVMSTATVNTISRILPFPQQIDSTYLFTFSPIHIHRFVFQVDFFHIILSRLVSRMPSTPIRWCVLRLKVKSVLPFWKIWWRNGDRLKVSSGMKPIFALLLHLLFLFDFWLKIWIRNH